MFWKPTYLATGPVIVGHSLTFLVFLPVSPSLLSWSAHCSAWPLPFCSLTLLVFLPVSPSFLSWSAYCSAWPLPFCPHCSACSWFSPTLYSLVSGLAVPSCSALSSALIVADFSAWPLSSGCQCTAWSPSWSSVCPSSVRSITRSLTDNLYTASPSLTEDL